MSSVKSSTILETKNLRKEFGSLAAVDGVSVSFKRNQICGLIGPNGAGKTTLVNLLSGGLPVTSGEIYFDGKSITGAAADEVTRAGLVRTFQVSNTFETLSTYDNVRLSLFSDKSNYNFWSDFDANEELNNEADEIISRFGLEDVAQQQPTELSHGQTRRIELAVAVANDPDMLLLDEPSSGVSGSELDEMTDLLEDIGSDIPLLLIEHNTEILEEICDRLIVLNEGELVADGDTSDVRNKEKVRRIYFGEKI
jgi:branched-chain amino acid transport system ATP-binding protein